MGKISNLPPLDRPREKALRYGIETLSNSELLAIVLSSGYKGKSASELAQEILCDYGGFHELASMDVRQLSKIKGLRNIRAITLKAVFEIHNRLNLPTFLKNPKSPNKPIDYLYQKYRERLSDVTQEYLIIALVNRRKEIIKEKTLYIGTETDIFISHKDIFREAFEANAYGFYLIHNHPGGDSKPSSSDFLTTGEIAKVGKSLGIYLIDHIIIGENGYYSFEEGSKEIKT